MQKKIWLLIFIIVFICELIEVQMNNELLQLIFKPLIVPSLIFYFNSQTDILRGLAKWTLPALVFSFAGDVLLMFQSKDELFFFLGLVAFLTAHVFYIIFFYKIKVAERLNIRILPVGIAAVYYAVLIGWLSPYLQKMKMPVYVYGIIISIMFMLAMQLLFLKKKSAGYKIFSGALLFVISDSVLAINKFYTPFEMAAIINILTYGLAQFFIIKGASDYIESKK